MTNISPPAVLDAIDKITDHIEYIYHTNNSHVKEALEHLAKARSAIECVLLIM